MLHSSSAFSAVTVLGVEMSSLTLQSRAWSCNSLDIGQKHLMGVKSEGERRQQEMQKELEARPLKCQMTVHYSLVISIYFLRSESKPSQWDTPSCRPSGLREAIGSSWTWGPAKHQGLGPRFHPHNPTVPWLPACSRTLQCHLCQLHPRTAGIMGSAWNSACWPVAWSINRTKSRKNIVHENCLGFL